MIVLVDAYNAIRCFEKAHGERFITRMQSYAYARRSTIHEVVVVFDGGDFRWASREKRGNILVVHAGQGMSADDWILSSCEGKKAHEYVLVTDDRALADGATQNGAFVLDVGTFFDCVAVAVEKRHLVNKTSLGAPLIEYDSIEDEFGNSNNLYLRELMEGSTRAIMIKKADHAEEGFRTEKRAEKPPASSKEEIRIRRIMKKL